MFQKLQKKLKEFFSEKGQGVVEYALVLGFVAIIAVYLIGTGDLKGQVVEKGVNNAKDAASVMDEAYKTAKSSANTDTNTDDNTDSTSPSLEYP